MSFFPSSKAALKKEFPNLEREFLGSRPSRAARARYRKWVESCRRQYPKDCEHRLRLLAAKHYKWGPPSKSSSSRRRKTKHKKVR